MSYILDALRRSQAERERGQVPGLGAQPLASTSSASQRSGPPVWGLAAAAGLMAVAVLALAWLWSGRSSTATPAAAVPPMAQQAPAPNGTRSSTADAPTGQQLPVVVSAPTLPSAPLRTPQQGPTPTPAVPATATTAATAVKPAQNTGVVAPSAGTAATPATQATQGTQAVAAAPAPTPAAEQRPVPLAQLNAEQRRDLPPLVVSGSIWSDSPASRFVMLNGQVMREGDIVAPGLRLERIAPKTAVLRWRDLRIEIAL